MLRESAKSIARLPARGIFLRDNRVYEKRKKEEKVNR